MIIHMGKAPEKEQLSVSVTESGCCRNKKEHCISPIMQYNMEMILKKNRVGPPYSIARGQCHLGRVRIVKPELAWVPGWPGVNLRELRVCASK